MVVKKYKDKEWLKNQYINLKKSDAEIAKECNVHQKTILRWRRRFNIISRTISEANKGKKGYWKGKKRSEETKKKMSKAKKGSKCYNWKGGRRFDSAGYILIYSPEHPFSNNNGYVFEHRLVMESFLKQFLNPENELHHINGNKQDNRLINLMLFENASKHQKYENQFRERDENGKFKTKKL